MMVRHSAIVILRISLLAVLVCVGCTQPPSEPETDEAAVDVGGGAKTGNAPSVVAASDLKDGTTRYVPFDPLLTPAEKKIYAARLKIIPQFTCLDEPLGDALRQLRKQVSVEIDADWPVLEEVGIGLDTLVTVDLTGRNLQTVLHRLLHPLELTWVIQDDAIWVTTRDEAAAHLTARVYDVVDLYEPDYGIDPLIDLITATVSPDSWDEAGGPGALDLMNSRGIRALVVSQTMLVHDEVLALLTGLRHNRHKGLDTLDAPVAADPELVARYQQRMARVLTPDSDRDELVRNINQFALKFYSQLAKENDGNLFFSPHNISTAFGMVYGGARGETADEIAKTMQWTLSGEKLHAAFQSLDDVRMLAAGSEPGKLSVANRLWGQNGYPFKPDFTDTTLDFYSAKLARVNFAESAAAARRINAWTNAQTAGLIPTAVDPESLNAGIRFVLTCAVYFNYPWEQEFSKDATRNAPFFIAGKPADVPTMTLPTDPCRYIITGGEKADDLQILEKPYAGGNLALVVLLPKKAEGELEKLEATLDLKSIETWNAAMQPREVDVHMPKFKYRQSFDLLAALSKMGIKRAFSPEADLSAISDEKPLFLDFATHQAVVDVNEEGTEAAAVTVTGGFGGGPVKQKRPPVFRANHPFIFYILDKRTGCILFMGRLVDPT